MPAISDDEATRFNRTLMEFDELSQSILKGHLLIEEQLTAILEHLVGRGGPVGDALDEVRLSVHQKAKLVRAAYADGCHAGTWLALKRLNALRNEMAHSLHSRKIPDLIEQLCKDMHINPNTQPPLRDSKDVQIETFVIALIFVSGDLRKLYEQLHGEA
jgi:hypothetical protein